MFLNKEEVLKFLPHRDPFLFIDSVEKVELAQGMTSSDVSSTKDLIGSKVIAHYSVHENLEILKGHFPGNPILPGVIQVEMMAQASAFVALALGENDLGNTSVDTLLLGVEQAKFRKPILPGMTCEIHSQVIKSRGQVAVYECEILSDGEKISQAQIVAKLVIKKEN